MGHDHHLDTTAAAMINVRGLLRRLPLILAARLLSPSAGAQAAAWNCSATRADSSGASSTVVAVCFRGSQPERQRGCAGWSFAIPNPRRLEQFRLLSFPGVVALWTAIGCRRWASIRMRCGSLSRS